MAGNIGLVVSVKKIIGQVVTNAEARFNKIHIRKVYACLAVTCHLHFWQNDRDFLKIIEANMAGNIGLVVSS